MPGHTSLNRRNCRLTPVRWLPYLNRSVTSST
jgi:hypothetical protein